MVTAGPGTAPTPAPTSRGGASDGEVSLLLQYCSIHAPLMVVCEGSSSSFCLPIVSLLSSFSPGIYNPSAAQGPGNELRASQVSGAWHFPSPAGAIRLPRGRLQQADVVSTVTQASSPKPL